MPECRHRRFPVGGDLAARMLALQIRLAAHLNAPSADMPIDFAAVTNWKVLEELDRQDS
jgi:hypothetical protein